jgi:chemotaxis protein MotB
VRSDQVTQVRGYADQFLRVKNNPYDPSNRRISILVKNAGAEAIPAIRGAKEVDGPTTASPARSATADRAAKAFTSKGEEMLPGKM